MVTHKSAIKNIKKVANEIRLTGIHLSKVFLIGTCATIRKAGTAILM